MVCSCCKFVVRVVRVLEAGATRAVAEEPEHADAHVDAGGRGGVVAKNAQQPWDLLLCYFGAC